MTLALSGGVFDSLVAGFFGASAGVSTKLAFDSDLAEEVLTAVENLPVLNVIGSSDVSNFFSQKILVSIVLV